MQLVRQPWTVHRECSELHRVFTECVRQLPRVFVYYVRQLPRASIEHVQQLSRVMQR